MKYTIKDGDTLSKIAQRYLGDARLANEIYEANRGRILNPDLIYAGNVIEIPNGKLRPGEISPETEPKNDPDRRSVFSQIIDLFKR